MKKIYLMYPQVIGKIAPQIYGHFTEHIGGVIYDGTFSGGLCKGDGVCGALLKANGIKVLGESRVQELLEEEQ